MTPASRRRFSRIAHALLPFAAPITDAAVEELLAILPLGAASTVLDAGCGRAELLLRMVDRFGLHGTGVDVDEEALGYAEAEARRRGGADRLSLVAGSALEVPAEPAFDLAVCVGSTHACGGFRQTLRFLAERTKRDGYVLVGEGFWRRPPDADYLASFGASADELMSHEENVAAAREAGLVPVWTRVSSDSDWDRYEGLYRFAMSRFLREHPDDPDAGAFRARSESWYGSYLRWGRTTMGFALYLLERARLERARPVDRATSEASGDAGTTGT